MIRRLIAVLAVCVLPVLPANAVTIEKVSSPGGIEAWLVQDHTNPIIAVNFSFRGGAALDPPGKTGLTEMVASLLDEGAGDLDSQAFHGKLENLAISFGYSASEDALHGHLKTIAANRDTAFDLLRLSLTQPRFDADAVERIRGQIQAVLIQELQNPNVIAERAFVKAMYPDHPYGLPVDGTPETITAITVDDLKGWVAAHMGRDQLYVSVVGDITPEQLTDLLDRTFGGLPAKAAPVAVADVAPATDGKISVTHRPIPQSVVMFGQAGLKRNDPDWYVAYVMNHILGGGSFSSRLMNEVRVKRGLAYGVYSYLLPHDHSALLAGSVATRNERVAESIQLIKDEWRRMAEGGVTAQELAEAKTYLNGSFPLQLDSTESIASLVEVVQMENLGIDYLNRRKALIDAVSADDVKRVARRLLDTDRLSFVVLGDPKGL
ncbi:pitrilysin family protein [Telmatospirillum sp.]|uniref:M16 family metallopeptidase n=1 Tax=Telmatospirillum sp. TaxID=2079197 RepID=UPI002851B86E|nr:pitrilysin family protein [Telmatospirillum sp.]MDR3435899.1 pitrilysin family protein [Telmatospirillum sp.]